MFLLISIPKILITKQILNILDQIYPKQLFPVQKAKLNITIEFRVYEFKQV